MSLRMAIELDAFRIALFILDLPKVKMRHDRLGAFGRTILDVLVYSNPRGNLQDEEMCLPHHKLV